MPKHPTISRGARFGRLTVIDFNTDTTGWGKRGYRCKCDCGQDTTVRGEALTSGRTKSCGCLLRQSNAEGWGPQNRPHLVNIGERYGRLTVIAHAASTAKGLRRYLCLCDCGNEKVITSAGLRHWGTKSCGCLRNERVRAATLEKNTTHGMTKTRTYASWRAMIKRCTNPNHRSFKNYGGRGITVCDRWRSFEAFLADMGERPVGKTLDRVDPDGNYEPGNCRWATNVEQRNNRRRTP